LLKCPSIFRNWEVVFVCVVGNQSKTFVCSM
jgi:hypothetical protein